MINNDTLPLTSIASLEQYDVVVDAASTPMMQHKDFERILQDHLEEYEEAPRLQKPMVTMKILDSWRQKNGRFLKHDATRNVWDDIGDKKAREHISSTLRALSRQRIENSRTRPLHEDQDLTGNKGTSTSALSVPASHRTMSSFFRKRAEERGKLFGRSKEQEHLIDLYHNCISGQKGAIDLVYICGPPGVGKTTLGLSLKPLVVREGGFFVHLNCAEFLPQDQPLAGYKSIVTSILRILFEDMPSNTKHRICQRLVREIGDESRVLSSVVPQFEQIQEIAAGTTVSRHTKDSQPPFRSHHMAQGSIVNKRFLREHATEYNDNTNFQLRKPVRPVGSNSHSARRLEYAFQKFLRLFTSQEHPVAVFIDDCQIEARPSERNSSTDTFELELVNLARTGSGGFFTMAAYPRDHFEATDSPDQEKALETTFRIPQGHHIPLEGLQESYLAELLGSGLSLSQSQEDALAKLFFRETGGNILSVLEVVRALQEDDLISWDQDSGKWECDIHLIAQHPSMQMSSLEDIFRHKISELPDDVKAVLKTCACLGVTFRLDVVKQVHATSTAPADLETSIQILEESGILFRENFSSPRLSFRHTWSRDAAYDMIPQQERASCHLGIGKNLWKDLQGNDMKELLFETVDQSLKGESRIANPEDRIALASLCLRAGEEAVESSGFAVSAMYTKWGIRVLGPKRWKNRNTYDLCLALHHHSIDTCYAAGRIDEVEGLIEAVLENARVFADKHRALMMKIYTLGTKREVSKALDLGVETLAKLGEKVDRNPSKIKVMLSVVKTRRMLRSRSESVLRRLPAMTDSRLLSCQIIYNVMWLSALYNNLPLAASLACRMVQNSVKHGVSVVSSVGFSSFATIVLRGGTNLQESQRYALLAMDNAERFGGETWKCRITSTLYGLVGIWLKPIPHCLEHLQHAFETGLETGDMECAMLNASLYIWSSYDRLPIGEIESRARNLSEQMKFVGQENAAFMLLPVWQMSLNFLGEAHGDPTQLIGNVLDENDLDKFAAATGRGRAMHINTSVYKLILAYHFGEFEKAASYTKISKLLYSSQGVLGVALARLYDSLSLLEVMKRKGNRRHFGTVKKHLVIFQYWAKHCPQNNMGKLCLVEAEVARVVGDTQLAKSKYYCSITHAKDGGILLEHALANERAGKFCLEINDLVQAKKLLKTSLELYSAWGGKAKVSHLQNEVGYLFE